MLRIIAGSSSTSRMVSELSSSHKAGTAASREDTAGNKEDTVVNREVMEVDTVASRVDMVASKGVMEVNRATVLRLHSKRATPAGTRHWELALVWLEVLC
jgi:hypothetical protein